MFPGNQVQEYQLQMYQIQKHVPGKEEAVWWGPFFIRGVLLNYQYIYCHYLSIWSEDWISKFVSAIDRYDFKFIDENTNSFFNHMVIEILESIAWTWTLSFLANFPLYMKQSTFLFSKLW